MQTLIWTTIIIMCVLVGAYITRRETIDNNGVTNRITTSRFWILAFIIVLVVAEGFRSGYEDTGNYKGIFSSLPMNLNEAFKQLPALEKGYIAFCWAIKQVHNNSQFFILVCSCIIVICDVLFLKKYSTNIVFSLFLYFTFSYVSSMNGIRQILAAIPLMIALPILEKKQWYVYLPLVILSSLLHKSALLLIPLYFAISGKRFNFGIFLVWGFAIISVLVPQVTWIVVGLLADEYSSYSNYVAGANILHVAVSLVPVVLALYYHKNQLIKADSIGPIKSEYTKDSLCDRRIDVLINMVSVSAAFMLMATRMAQFARINAYFRNAAALLIPVLIEKCFSANNRKIVRTVSIICYFAYYAVVVFVELKQFDIYSLNFSLG